VHATACAHISYVLGRACGRENEGVATALQKRSGPSSKCAKMPPTGSPPPVNSVESLFFLLRLFYCDSLINGLRLLLKFAESSKVELRGHV
jgi:hypothetical protein